jgi:hypothetical protein
MPAAVASRISRISFISSPLSVCDSTSISGMIDVSADQVLTKESRISQQSGKSSPIDNTAVATPVSPNGCDVKRECLMDIQLIPDRLAMQSAW